MKQTTLVVGLATTIPTGTNCEIVHLSKDERQEDELRLTNSNTNTLLNEEVTNNDNNHQHTPKHLKSRIVKSPLAFPLLPKETTPIEKSGIGILSNNFNDKESITDDHHQDEIVLSVHPPQGVQDRQAQSQGRRLDALSDFIALCDATNIPGLSGSDAYVDCVNGRVRGDYNTRCKAACGSFCCTGDSTNPNSCNGFTGKGKQVQVIIWFNLL